ncbi:hypothetical protein [Pseudoxanthomonas koreensis]|uniref:hypothetical protein n=1 Tax=Pseudoxanthomonas koreensis TaxID=266061 RepID=UPI0013910622|nr:hypothetical protein [Pseudoxanthomonas koreensis]KAF1694566.1 hypothetical protein CSC64_03905 [Pseudoxanthomonas koreensis]
MAFRCLLLLLLLVSPALLMAADAHRVTSPAVPESVFAVDASLAPLPVLRFPIGDTTDAERHLFVDVADGVVQRLVVLQFETVQAGSDFRFVFPAVPPRRFGPHVYRSGAYAYDDVAAAARAPGLEADRTRAALVAAGLQPPRYWHVARLARVADAAGLHEAIVFYLENADARYPAGLVDVDEDGDGLLDAAETARLWAALEGVLSVLPGTAAAADAQPLD